MNETGEMSKQDYKNIQLQYDKLFRKNKALMELLGKFAKYTWNNTSDSEAMDLMQEYYDFEKLRGEKDE